MSLTARLLNFFLGTILVVLAAFGGTLYWLADNHLYGRVDERLEAAAATIIAAAEVKKDCVEWEPDERSIRIGSAGDAGTIRWTVADIAGPILDGSPDRSGSDTWPSADDGMRNAEIAGESWRVLRRTVRPPEAPNLRFARREGESDRDEGGRRVAGLVITVGLSLVPVADALRSLAWLLAGLSGAVWIAAAVLGRRLCRRVLAPVRTMTAASEEISVSEPGAHLPLPGTGDELERLARAFNGLLGRLGEAFERQRRFTGDASHQLRTPLAVMLGQVEVALRRDRPAEEYRRVLELVGRRTSELHRIVEALLFLARADAEGRIEALGESDLRELVAGAAARWADRDRGGDVRIDAGPRTLPAKVHPELFAQLLDNLIENAAKYTPAGTPIRVTAALRDGRTEVSIEDVGEGIPADELPHLFEPFFRGRHARRDGRPGIGLGLAVAKRIAEAFGGTVAAEPGRTRGALFTVSIPAAFSVSQSGTAAAGASHAEAISAAV